LQRSIKIYVTKQVLSNMFSLYCHQRESERYNMRVFFSFSQNQMKTSTRCCQRLLMLDPTLI